MKHPWDQAHYGPEILESVVRVEMASQSKPNKKTATRLACLILKDIWTDIQYFRVMYSEGKINLIHMTPKEHEEALNELSQNARHLLGNMWALNLPVNIAAYFPEAYPSLPGWPSYETGDDPERELQHILKMRSHGTHIDSWLRVLSDKDRLKAVAQKSPLRKANVKNPLLNYTVRMIARSFYTHYGKKMPTTIERICFLEFPEADVSNNTISAILRPR